MRTRLVKGGCGTESARASEKVPLGQTWQLFGDVALAPYPARQYRTQGTPGTQHASTATWKVEALSVQHSSLTAPAVGAIDRHALQTGLHGAKLYRMPYAVQNC
jgi:hypothetical protein